MPIKKVLFIVGCYLVLSGCTDFFMICSLHPFYLDNNVVLSPGVEGCWSARPVLPKSTDEKTDIWFSTDTVSHWKIQRYVSRSTQKTASGKDSTVLNPMNFYEVKLVTSAPDSSNYSFKMVLFRINHALYADFSPRENMVLSESRMARESYFPVHTLAKLKISGSNLDISWLGAGYMKEMIEKKRVRVKYKWVDGAKRLLLTGTSEQLTGMIERYAGEPRFIDWENQQAMLHLTLKSR